MKTTPYTDHTIKHYHRRSESELRNSTIMKQLFRTVFVTTMAMTMVAFVGCGKEENNIIETAWGNGTEPPTQGEWVDLGLQSGLLWASCNVGATVPEEYGEYFAWGETQPKSVYDWSTYRYCTVDADGFPSTLTKYNNETSWGTVDNLSTLLPADDAATARLRNGARTPTYDEWNELLNNTSVERATLNGVNGLKFTGSNGNTIFLPAAGQRDGGAGNCGDYWSASLGPDNSILARLFFFDERDHFMLNGGYVRCSGCSVRAVCASLD